MSERILSQSRLVAMALFLAVSFSQAAYQPIVVLKNPYASEHTDSLGNVTRDSLARHKTLMATLYRTGMTDSLTVEGATNDSGFCRPLFDRWPNIGSLVEPGSIERLDIALPNTYRATKTGAGFTFEPLRIECLSATGRIGETLVVVLPLSVTKRDTTIGSGPYEFDFVVLADPHLVAGKKTRENGWGDFGEEGWDDADTGLSENNWPIPVIEASVAFINSELVGQPECDARFVVIAGDVTHMSERSEFQRARQVFAGLDDRLFLVPLLGNHDGWPYVGIIPDLFRIPPGPFYEFDEQEWNYVCIGEYFVDAFRGVYDSLRILKPAPNWQQSDYLLTSTDSTCQDWPSYYVNFGFSYEGTRFIATDFTTRKHAPDGWPGMMFDPDTYLGEQYHWTIDWLKSQVDSVPDGERIVCLGHNPYSEYVPGNFCAEELHGIADSCGLKNNKPIATSIGGHIEEESHGRLRYGSDTICDFFTLGAAKEGYVYVFRVKDDVRLQVTHSNPGPTLSGRTVHFTADYDYQGTANKDHDYWWDFGDGATLPDGGPSPSHTYWDVSRDTTYKVSVRVTTDSGRRVWACDTVHPTRIQGAGWTEMEPLPDFPSGKAIKDGGCMAYEDSSGLIFASKGYKTGDFYVYLGDHWYELASVDKGTEGKQVYKGSAMCSGDGGHLYLTKGNNTCGFYAYNVWGNYWTQKTNVPLGPSRKKVKQGASLAWAGSAAVGHEVAYLLKGYRNEFYRYDPVANEWKTLLDAPIGVNNRIKYDAGSWLVSESMSLG